MVVVVVVVVVVVLVVGTVVVVGSPTMVVVLVEDVVVSSAVVGGAAEVVVSGSEVGGVAGVLVLVTRVEAEVSSVSFPHAARSRSPTAAGATLFMMRRVVWVELLGAVMGIVDMDSFGWLGGPVSPPKGGRW